VSRDPVGGVLRNLLDIQRLGNGVSIEVRSLVEQLFDELAGEIARVDPSGTEQSRARVVRLEGLLGEIESLVGQSFQEIRRTLTERLAAIGVQQAQWAQSHLSSTVGSVEVDIKSGRVGLGLMRAIVEKDPFEGAPLKAWVDGIEGSLTHQKLGAVRRQLQIGMTGNEPLPKLIQRIRGRSDGHGGFVGGVLQTTTRQAEAIARTGVNFIANRGHLETYKANVDILTGLEFTATLDRRTTEICMALDGEILDAKKPDPNKVPPRHWRCRSVLVPVVDWVGLGIEPPVEGKRASADGPVPSSVKYEEWLRAQPAADQDEILGPAKADLFRRGKLSLRDLVTSDQKVLTVAEIRARPSDAPKKPPVTPAKLAAAIGQEERAIADLDIEHAAVFDPKTAELVFRKTSGAPDYVAFTNDEVAQFRGMIFTHNHPRSSSFSREDVGFATKNDLAEMRVISRFYGYRLIRPDGGWEDFGAVNRRFGPALQKAVVRLRKRIDSGEMTEDEAGRELFHQVWRDVFRGTATRYIRRRR
jgi:SPP1 gp7 family putative phage head morphogenesis protein